jgi:hypothetical protein
MLSRRLSGCVFFALAAACSSAGPAPAGSAAQSVATDSASPATHGESCAIGPGPSFEAVVALGSDVATYAGAAIHVCRNGGPCADAVFALPAEPIAFETGSGPSFPYNDDYRVAATFWNEGSDGYVLDITYLAETAVADGDTYLVTVTPADAGAPAVNLNATAVYTHIANCAGGYPYFRIGVPCTEQAPTTPCAADWDPIECKCQGS